MRLTAFRDSIGLRLWGGMALLVCILVPVHLWFLSRHDRISDVALERGRQLTRILEGHLIPEMGAVCADRFSVEIEAYAADSTIVAAMLLKPDGRSAFGLERDFSGVRSSLGPGGDSRGTRSAFRSEGGFSGPRFPFDQTEFRPCDACHTARSTARTRSVESPREGRLILVAQTLGHRAVCLTCHVQDAAHRATLHLALRPSPTEEGRAVQRRRLLTAGILVLVATLAGIAVLIHRLVNRPLRALLAGVRRVEGGNFSSRVSLEGKNEFGEIAGAFNAMTARLAEVNRRQVTTIRDQSRELKRSQRQILHQEKLAGLGLMAAGIAHEIGNPLASISAVAQILARRSEDRFTREQTELILRHIKRISGIVRDLGDLSRPPSTTPEACRINEVVHTSITLLRHDRRFKHVAVNEALDPSLPEVHLVPDHLLQICFNLGLNAMEAMEGRGILDVSTSLETEGVRIRFRDNGPGIPHELRSDVFNPFFTTKSTGTGLGLSVSYGLARSLGGDLRLEPREGPGACFVILIPLQPLLATETPPVVEPEEVGV